MVECTTIFISGIVYYSLRLVYNTRNFINTYMHKVYHGSSYVRSRCIIWSMQYYDLNKRTCLYPSIASRRWTSFFRFTIANYWGKIVIIIHSLNRYYCIYFICFIFKKLYIKYSFVHNFNSAYYYTQSQAQIRSNILLFFAEI